MSAAAEALKAMENSISKAIVTANTPEEAYKAFMAVAGAGFTDVMAKALAAAVGQALHATKDKKSIEGWDKLVTGCVLKMDFGSPFDPERMAIKLKSGVSISDYFKDILVTSLRSAAVAAITTADARGGSISVGGCWNF